MNLLLTGRGGREHALAQALNESPSSPTLFVHPGSDALATLATRIPAGDVSHLIETARAKQIELLVAGEEALLAEGLADAALEAGIPTFGPKRAAARLESSKTFAKEFMRRHNIPTASYRVVDHEEELHRAIHSLPVVLKFDGLAAGKGVSVCKTEAEVEAFSRSVFADHRFGAGDVIVEECLTGPEVSVICAVSDGDVQLFPPARDYKRQRDGDQGPNTGGMGAVASSALLPEETLVQIESEVIRPTLRGLEADGLPYRGFLYFGLMLTPKGPQLLEYNCRFGDPEAQAVLPLVEGDFAGYLHAAAQGRLERDRIRFADGWSVCLVLASRDYPAASSRGPGIQGLDAVTAARIYHAGTERSPDGSYSVNGGRILAVSARGESRREAVDLANHEANKLCFDGMQRRSDIGQLHFETSTEGLGA